MSTKVQYIKGAFLGGGGAAFVENSTLFSAFSLSRSIETGHRQSHPVDECSEEKREGLGREKCIQDET